MAQPDISQILAALAQQNQGGTPQPSATPQQPYSQPPPNVYGNLGAAHSPQGGAGFLPQPSNTGSVDLSSIRPSNSGSVSIADAIAKAKSIAADRGVNSFDPRLGTPRDDPRAAGRSFRSRSRSPARRDDYSNPYRDERRVEPRRGGGSGGGGGYRRSPSPDRNVRGRDSQAGGRSDGTETETIRVKSSLVGLIIGRNGENLRKVESETGARVQFIQPKDTHQAERQCTISGSFRSREDAKNAIFTIIEENGGSNIMNEKGAYTAGMPGRAKVNLPALREGESSTQLLVPDKTVGLIIGRGGETIKDVQEKSGCHVNIVGENKSISGQRPVNLIGSEHATRIARELIMEIVESDNRGGTAAAAGSALSGIAGFGSGSGPNNVPATRDRGFDNFGGRDGNGDGYEEKTIKVPSEAVGMIIGKGGETIKELQRTSGCKINVNQPKPPDVTRNIDLAGTRHSLQQAERVIWEKVKTVQERDAAAGRGHASEQNTGSGYDSGAPRYDAYSQLQQQQTIPGYGQFGQQAATPTAMSGFQMPFLQQQQQSTPQQGAADPAQLDAAQAFYAHWYAQQMAQLSNQGGQPGGPPPGTQ